MEYYNHQYKVKGGNMNIELEKIYTPRQIASLGFIKNSKGNNDYNFVLELVLKGVLKTLPSLPNAYYRILGKDVLEYKKVYEGYQDIQN